MRHSTDLLIWIALVACLLLAACEADPEPPCPTTGDGLIRCRAERHSDPQVQALVSELLEGEARGADR